MKMKIVQIQTPCMHSQMKRFPQSEKHYGNEFQVVTTLALGSQPRQGLAKMRAKSET
jgi:hypothetical protein